MPEDVSWSHFFRIRENVSQSFRTKFLSLLYMISLAWKTSPCLCANHNPELRCVICTGVTLFAPVLHLNCTALSQSEASNFFHVYYIISTIIDREEIKTDNFQSTSKITTYSWELHMYMFIVKLLLIIGWACYLFCVPMTSPATRIYVTKAITTKTKTKQALLNTQ